MPFGEGEQLDEARSLPQPPGVLLDGPVTYRDAKTAEQPDPYALGLFGHLSRRLLLFSAGALRCRAIPTPIATEACNQQIITTGRGPCTGSRRTRVRPPGPRRTR